MTDKQIIIDGCDVSGCEYIDKDSCCNLFEGLIGTPCSSYYFRNCHYKQLKRKEQECEKLKKQLMQKSEVDMFFNTPIEGWSNDPCGICQHKAENEQLKEELSAIQHNCNREGCKYYDDNTFKVFYECKAQKALQLSANSVTTKYCDLLQTLAEIKEIAKYELNNLTESAINGGRYVEILQKISECEVVDEE